MKTCKACKYWARATDTSPREQKPGGFCGSEKITEDYGVYELDMMVYPYNEGGMFWTGPDFGCVHHEANNVQP